MSMCAKYTSARITAYIPKDASDFLEKWAVSENRTISNLAATILLTAIETKQKEANSTDNT